MVNSPPAELELALADEIARGGPWGQGFPEPMFHGDFDIVHQRVVGERHLKLSLRNGRSCRGCNRVQSATAASGRTVRGWHIDLSRNDYRDRVTLQLMVEYIERGVIVIRLRAVFGAGFSRGASWRN